MLRFTKEQLGYLNCISKASFVKALSNEISEQDVFLKFFPKAELTDLVEDLVNEAVSIGFKSEYYCGIWVRLRICVAYLEEYKPYQDILEIASQMEGVSESSRISYIYGSLQELGSKASVSSSWIFDGLFEDT